MDRFHRFFLSLNERQRVDLAKAVGTTQGYIKKCFCIKRKFSPGVCAAIERESLFQVMRWDLRPEDWWQIWPELVCHPNAPEVPKSSVSSIPDGLVPSPKGLGSFSAEVKHV